MPSRLHACPNCCEDVNNNIAVSHTYGKYDVKAADFQIRHAHIMSVQ